MPFPACCQIGNCRGPPKDFEIKFVSDNGRNKFSFSCPCGLRYFSTLEWRNIVTHGQLKENLYIYISCGVYRSGRVTGVGIRHQSDWLIVLHIPNACLASPPLCIYHLKFEWKKIIDRSFGGGERGIVLCFY